jgi:hypothetical protein
MAKQHLLMLGLIVGGSVAFQACSSDSNAGKTGTGSEAGAAGETGEAPVPLNPQAVVVTAADATTSSHLLVANTDFMTATAVSSVALDTGKIEGTTEFADKDGIAFSSAGLGFAIERTNDKVDLLDGNAIKTTFDLKDLGNGDTVALADKAYVPLLQQSLITVLDLKAGTVSSRIDLSKYNDPSDSDGSADIGAAVYDSTKKIAYFVLGRIDFTTFDAAGHLPCSTTKALIVAIDATTDEVIDLNGTADGEAAELSLTSPSSVSLAADGSLVVLADGCYTDTTLKNSGVEVVDTTTGLSQIVYASKSGDFLGKLVLTGASDALLGTFDSSFTSHWYKFDLTAGKLGDELIGVPDAVSFDGTNLLGVDTTGAVVSYDPATGKSTAVSETTWAGKYTATGSTALVE